MKYSTPAMGLLLKMMHQPSIYVRRLGLWQRRQRLDPVENASGARNDRRHECEKNLCSGRGRLVQDDGPGREKTSTESNRAAELQHVQHVQLEQVVVADELAGRNMKNRIEELERNQFQSNLQRLTSLLDTSQSSAFADEQEQNTSVNLLLQSLLSPPPRPALRPATREIQSLDMNHLEDISSDSMSHIQSSILADQFSVESLMDDGCNGSVTVIDASPDLDEATPIEFSAEDIFHVPTPALTTASTHTSNTPSASEFNTADQRFTYLLSCCRLAGFPTFDAAVTEYYTTSFSEYSTPYNAQKISRKRHLPDVIAKLSRHAAQAWTPWEADGYRDGVVRAAEDILLAEIKSEGLQGAVSMLNFTIGLRRHELEAGLGDGQGQGEVLLELRRLLEKAVSNLRCLILIHTP